MTPIQVPWIRENYHWVPRIKEIRSLQVHNILLRNILHYTLGCIRSPELFSNNFYLVLKYCILVKNETSEFFAQLVDVQGCIKTPKFFPRGWNLQIMKFGHNLVSTWIRNMILVSNPTKIHTSYSLKLSDRLKKLSSFHLHWFLFE